jgi:hypothetical protein
VLPWAAKDTVLEESGVMGICVVVREQSADWIKSVGKIRGPVEERFGSGSDSQDVF